MIRRWGRLGTTIRRPRQLASVHLDQPAAQAALCELLARRWRRGYRPAAPPGVATGEHEPERAAARSSEPPTGQLALELAPADGGLRAGLSAHTHDPSHACRTITASALLST